VCFVCQGAVYLLQIHRTNFEFFLGQKSDREI
jgi:hypothetical protein